MIKAEALAINNRVILKILSIRNLTRVFPFERNFGKVRFVKILAILSKVTDLGCIRKRIFNGTGFSNNIF